MKKTLKIILISIATLLLLIILTAVTIPVLFKEKIKNKIELVINESVNAEVSFGDYKLGFFRNFPNISFSLDNITVKGIEKFEKDTLASVKSVNLILNLSSLFKKTGVEVKSIIVDNANVKTIVLSDGSANWDIMKETEEEVPAETDSSDFKILLKKVSLLNSSLLYTDYESDINVSLYGINSELTGDLTASETDLLIKLGADQLNYAMEGMKYIDRARLYAELNLLADLDKYKFTFRDNFLTLNDLKILFSGWISMPEDDIETDLEFRSEQSTFKTLLSLVPAFYMKDFSNLRADGEFSLSGSAKGVYSDADSTLPDIALNLKIKNGLVKYPSLPEQINNINLSSELFVDGKDMDKTTLNIQSFHMEMAGNPFDMSLALKTPVSDPDIKGTFMGKINLDALSKALPLDSIGLSGLIDMSVVMDGRLSMIEKKQYEQFKASGSLSISDMQAGMKDYPEVNIKSAQFEFTPAYAEMKQAILGIEKNSDFSISGKLENYIPYILSDAVIKGNLNLRSKLVDLTEIMSKLGADTTEEDDTTSLSVIKVPENIDFDFTALIDEFRYGKIRANNIRGHLIVRDGTVSIKETGMNILGGQVSLNALYDTRDTLKPVVRAELALQQMGIRDAFNTFNTVQKLAPAAKGVEGKMTAKLSYSSLLRKDFMPVIRTITGGGKLETEEVKLLESASFDKMKEVLKLRNDYTNVFKDINVSFKINEGRIYVSPFNTRVGNIKMNISGDQGIDQTLNYVIKTEIPRAELGSSVNSLIDNMSAQAAMLGLAFKPAEIMKINVKVTGTFGKPVITPFFGDTPVEGGPTIKEAATDAARQLVDDAADQAREKARIEAQKQGDLLVREAEEKAAQIRDEAVKLAERIRKEADEQAQKLIKEAESKGTVAKMAASKGAEKIKAEAEKRAQQVIKEADEKATALVEEAKLKREELTNKI